MKSTVVLAVLVFLASLAYANVTASELPEKVVITVGKTKVEGFKGSPEAVRTMAHEEHESHEQKLPLEGFVYRRKVASDDAFEVMAWSSKGRSKTILTAAQKHLEKVFREISTVDGEEPAGYLFSDKDEENLYRKDESKGSAGSKTALANSQGSKMVIAPAAKQVQLASTGGLVEKNLVENAVVGAANADENPTTSPWVNLDLGIFDYPLGLSILLLLLLLAVAARIIFKARSRKKLRNLVRRLSR